jgi:ubiquinone/menaquinone biosynthesis C-methylase UbiE
MEMLKDEYIDRNGLMIPKNNPHNNKQWVGSLVAPWYDKIMERNIIPKKFGASFDKHIAYLKDKLGEIENNKIIEISTGSGNMATILNKNNEYYGIDISKSLLRIAKNKFEQNSFSNYKLFVCDASELPFSDSVFI